MVTPLAPKNANGVAAPSSFWRKQGAAQTASKVQPRKDSNPRAAAPIRQAPVSPPAPQPTESHLKKVGRRSSKPIINWFQRKLAGSTRARRASESNGRPPLPQFAQDATGSGVPTRERKTGRMERPRSTPGTLSASLLAAEVPPPVPSIKRNTNSISLNGDGQESSSFGDEDDESVRHSSMTRGSLRSPYSLLEADEDASVRPIPPSGPPSPSPSYSPSQSSASYRSDPRTFRSMAASTKPTTVLSIDMSTNGMAHIAQAPPTPLSQSSRFPHIRTSSLGSPVTGGAGSISFALPMSAQSSSPSDQNGSTQAPLHTTHHPRDNPRPFSPPPDDASVLTLASSAFGIPGARIGAGALAYHHGHSSTLGGDSISQFDGLVNDGASTIDDTEGDKEVNASMRALRSRRSWESEASRWSARIGGNASLGPGTPLGDQSLWAGNSLKTGAGRQSGDDNEDDDAKGEGSGSPVRRSEDNESSESVVTPPANGETFASKTGDNGFLYSPLPEKVATEASSDNTSHLDREVTPGPETVPLSSDSSSHSERDVTPGPEEAQITPVKDDAAHLEGETTPNKNGVVPKDYFSSKEERPRTEREDENETDTRSLMTDGQTDVWISAPSTPLVPN